MSDYIDRKEAILRLSKWLEKASDTNNRGLYNFGEIAAYQTSIKEINSLPVADVRPVVHGNWVGIDDEPFTTWECDRCGCIYEADFAYIPNFCPNCGAKMRKKDEDKLVADVRTVVLCRDCKHNGWVQEPEHGKSVDYCRLIGRFIDKQFFCAAGERKINCGADNWKEI